MYRYAFPKCPVEGSVQPVPFGHFLSNGAVPAKCAACGLFLEGECLRAMQAIEGYQVLDHGACPVQGDTSPTKMIEENTGRVFFVPAKCAACGYLFSNSTRGFFCTYQQQIWGDFPRSLDWGHWRPGINPIGVRCGYLGCYYTVIPTMDVLSEMQKHHWLRAATMLTKLYPELDFSTAKQCLTALSNKRAGNSL
jgi:hypothetical protein